MSEIDNIIPKEKWQFGRDVAECFPNMLERSIPGYVQMRELTFAVGEKYLRKDGKISNIVDIGCSNGLSIYPFLQKYGARIRSFLVDNSEAMIEAVNKEYSGWISCGAMQTYCCDITKQYPQTIADLTLLVLSLQFVPIEERQQLLKKIYNHTEKGGAIILVEKVQGEDAEMDDLLTDCYYAQKRANGYSDTQIIEKRRSLRGVLVNLKPEWNEELLRDAGFTNIQMFWRHLNFCGWVAKK